MVLSVIITVCWLLQLFRVFMLITIHYVHLNSMFAFAVFYYEPISGSFNYFGVNSVYFLLRLHILFFLYD